MRRREYEDLWDLRSRPDRARDKLRRVAVAFGAVLAIMLAYGFIFWAFGG